MADDDKLIAALQEALTFVADKTPLRRQLADALFKSGRFAEAEKEYREVVAALPDDQDAQLALAETFHHQEKWYLALVILEPMLKQARPPAQALTLSLSTYRAIGQHERAAELEARIAASPSSPSPVLSTAAQYNAPLPPPPAPAPQPPLDGRLPVSYEPQDAAPEAELERSQVTFAQVGGMEKLKEEIRLKIIHPLKNPQLFQAYGKKIGGGILMYGPPGCGKTHLARATAGEVNAYFLSLGIHEVLSMWLGASENRLHAIFDMARRNTPCVLFIDEVDALGASRSDMRHSAGRHLINQLLAEMDGVDASNEGILILAASNAPWHIDSALRRPGRFDRVMFVPPPDRTARNAILKIMLEGKPAQAIDHEAVAKATDGFSGADLKALVDRAVESKLDEAMRRGVPVPITTQDLVSVAQKQPPTTKEWFATARNYALYSNESGAYDDVLEYLKQEQQTNNFFGKLLFGRNS